MEFGVWTKGLATLAVDCLVLGVFEDGELAGEARSVDSASGGHLKKLLGRGDFAGRPGDTLLVGDVPGIAASRVLLTGLGAKKSFQRKSWRKAWTAAAAALARTRIGSCAVALDRPEARALDDYYLGRAVAEITGATLYRVNDLKTAKKPPAPALKKVLAGPVRKAAAAERGLAHGAAVAPRRRACSATWRTCRPTSARPPTSPSRRARSASATPRCASRCSTRRRSAARRWAACWRSPRAAHEPPRFIVLEHRGGKADGGAGGAGRQGRHLRHRRHLAQGPAGAWTR